MINPERRDWRREYHAAKRWHAVDGDLRVPPKTIDYEAHRIKLGVALANARQRRAALPPERLDALSALDMRWT